MNNTFLTLKSSKKYSLLRLIYFPYFKYIFFYFHELIYPLNPKKTVSMKSCLQVSCRFSLATAMPENEANNIAKRKRF